MTDIWNLRAQEDRALLELDNGIASVSKALDMARRASALRDSSGFPDFIAALDGVIRFAEDRMISADLSDHELREARGQATAYRRVRTMLTSTDSADVLASKLEELQNRRSEVSKRIPKPR